MRTLLLPLLVVAGCADIDPLTRPDAWHPVNANDANLQAMLANPGDYVSGTAAPLADGNVVSAAVARYRAGKVRQLPDSGLAKIVPVAIGTPVSQSGSDQ